MLLMLNYDNDMCSHDLYHVDFDDDSFDYDNFRIVASVCLCYYFEFDDDEMVC